MTSPQTSILTAPAFTALVLLGLLLIAERVGLPGGWVRVFFFGVALLAVLAVLWSSRTIQERAFLGLSPALGPLAGGMVLAMVTTLAISRLVPSTDGPQWLACLIGAPTGLVLAHVLVRKAARVTGDGPHQSEMSSPRFGFILRGAGLVLVGAAITMTGLDEARRELVRLLPWVSSEGAGILALSLALLAVLVGGMRASVLQAAVLTLAVTSALALMLVIGLVHFGALPLPGQSEAKTLAAIAEARGRWAITTPLHFLQWPDWTAAFQGAGLQSFGLSALIAAGIAMALSTALPVRRKSMTVVAVSGTLVLPLAAIAIAGYAIEAATSLFLSASIGKPPAALVESARLGIVSFCGAMPDSADALRQACGVSPRDTAALAWGQIGLSSAYIRSGLSAALGYSTTVSMMASIATVAGLMAMITLGLGIAAQGLGQHLLARNYRAAGLASLRLGLGRLSVAILAVSLVMLPTAMVMASQDHLLTGLATGSGVLVAMALWAAFEARRPAKAPETPATPVRSRKRKGPLAASETA